MAESLTLKIYTPEKTALNTKAYRVQLPYGKINLTVLQDRAPTSLVIHAGVLQILEPDDSIKAWYFIDSGVADIAQDTCQISTRHLIEHSHIDTEKALQLAESEPENAVFYNMIANYLQNFA